MSTSELRRRPLVAGADRAGLGARAVAVLAVWVLVVGLCLACWAGVGLLFATLI